jgi:hypothetical protein
MKKLIIVLASFVFLTNGYSQEPNICVVSYDLEDTYKPMVVWDWLYFKELNATKVNIYRTEVPGEYKEPIGTVTMEEIGVFVDYEKRQEDVPYYYSITYIDEKGEESPFSLFHKNIMLDLTYLPPDTVVLRWDDYITEKEILPFEQLVIMKGEDSTNLNDFAQLEPGTYEFTDIDPRLGEKDTLYYRVAGILPYICDATMQKASGGPFSRAVSNLEDNRLKETDIKKSKLTKFEVYPNPTDDKLVIAFGIQESAAIKIDILSTLGKRLAVLADKEFGAGNYSINPNLESIGVANGIYYVRIKAGSKQLVKQLVKE